MYTRASSRLQPLCMPVFHALQEPFEPPLLASSIQVLVTSLASDALLYKWCRPPLHHTEMLHHYKCNPQSAVSTPLSLLTSEKRERECALYSKSQAPGHGKAVNSFLIKMREPFPERRLRLPQLAKPTNSTKRALTPLRKSFQPHQRNSVPKTEPSQAILLLAPTKGTVVNTFSAPSLQPHY